MQQFANEQSFKIYVDYLALKKHFTTDTYDYFKYNGKVKTSYDKFLTRPDAFYFNKLTAKPEYKNLIIANIIKKPTSWIRDILGEEGREIYLAWKKNVDSLTVLVTSELSKLDEDFEKNFTVPKNSHPLLMSLYLQRKISLETFTILFHISKVDVYWSETITDKFIAKDIMRLARKYYPFLELDEKKFSDLVKTSFFAV